MEKFKQSFENKHILVFDQGVAKKEEHFFPFAYTDIFTVQTGITKIPIIHFWELENTVILGMKDTRVTHLKEGLQTLKEHHFEFLARNSGGLAVVSDQGILNISLIVPNIEPTKFSIPEGYDLMVHLMELCFADFPIQIEAKEVKDSYCPGDYDLSINGKKFAGIAQRRVRDGVAVMIYLSISGDQHARGQLVQDFYHSSLKDNFGKNGYPPVRPESMGNLTELLGIDITISEVKKRVLKAFTDVLQSTLSPTEFTEYISKYNLEEEFQTQLNKMIRRNEIVKKTLEEYNE